MDDYNKQVNEVQNKLSMTMTALNRENLILEEKTKEKINLDKELASLKEEVSIAKTESEQYKTEKDIAKNNMLEVKNQIGKEQNNLNLLISQVVDVELELASFKKSAANEMTQIKSDNSAFLVEINKNNTELQNDIKNLSDSSKQIFNETKAKVIELDKLTKTEAEKNQKIEEIKASIDRLLDTKSSVEGNIQKLKNDVIDQETIIEKNKAKIDSSKVEISGLEASKESIISEIEKQEETRVAFVQAKMILQKDKEELTNRELYIMSKYEQAGVTYSNPMLETTKEGIAGKAELVQIKSDLDKREKFIKDKYQKAGIDYL